MSSADAKSYEGWDTESHLKTFDVWNGLTEPHFNFAYGCFAEQKFLNSAIRSLTAPDVLDVGCATGTTYRFLRNTNKAGSFGYAGVDLSGPAVEHAKRLYPGVSFTLKGREKLRDFCKRTYGVVYSRDTVMHQTEPLAFLSELMDVAEHFLVLRLRTRDRGATVWDIEASCQMHYDRYWMPYVVINIDELLDFLRRSNRVKRVTLNRSYEVLGGKNFRFLPKPLYLTEAGGAETALLIEFARPDDPAKFEVGSESTLEGHAYLRANRLRQYAHALVSKVARRLGR